MFQTQFLNLPPQSYIRQHPGSRQARMAAVQLIKNTRSRLCRFWQTSQDVSEASLRPSLRVGRKACICTQYKLSAMTETSLGDSAHVERAQPSLRWRRRARPADSPE